MDRSLKDRIESLVRRLYRRLGRLRAPVVNDFRALSSRVSDSTDHEAPTRVLLVSSNGAGLGHLSRLNAVSKHLKYPVLFYTMSSAYYRLNKKQNEIIYFPSYGDLGMDGRKWNPLMEAHFSAVVRGYRPTVIVFDGTYVYSGVTRAARNLGIPLVWMQRGCWKSNIAERSVQKKWPEQYVDMVIVPGDYGHNEHPGNYGVPVEQVSPITTTDRDQLLSRDQAIRQLGLTPGKKYFLVQVGAGVINDTTDTIALAVHAIRSLGSEWEPILVRNPLKQNDHALPVRSVDAFPLSLYLNAFEAGVFAAGYNTVQEAVTAGLPAVFVPNLKTKTDDQQQRATGMASRGLGIAVGNSDELVAAIHRLGDDEERRRMRQRLEAAYEKNGAKLAAKIIERHGAPPI